MFDESLVIRGHERLSPQYGLCEDLSKFASDVVVEFGQAWIGHHYAVIMHRSRAMFADAKRLAFSRSYLVEMSVEGMTWTLFVGHISVDTQQNATIQCELRFHRHLFELVRHRGWPDKVPSNEAHTHTRNQQAIWNLSSGCYGCWVSLWQRNTEEMRRKWIHTSQAFIHNSKTQYLLKPAYVELKRWHISHSAQPPHSRQMSERLTCCRVYLDKHRIGLVRIALPCRNCNMHRRSWASRPYALCALSSHICHFVYKFHLQHRIKN